MTDHTRKACMLIISLNCLIYFILARTIFTLLFRASSTHQAVAINQMSSTCAGLDQSLDELPIIHWLMNPDFSDPVSWIYFKVFKQTSTSELIPKSSFIWEMKSWSPGVSQWSVNLELGEKRNHKGRVMIPSRGMKRAGQLWACTKVQRTGRHVRGKKRGERWKKMKRLCKVIVDEIQREADFILRERVCICCQICLFFTGKKIHFH